MAWIRCMGGSGGQPVPTGVVFDSILTAGQISKADPQGAYMTASFNDVSNEEYLAIKVYTEDNGTEYFDTALIPVSRIPSSGALDFIVYLRDASSGASWLQVRCDITLTQVRSYQYSGSFRDIYIDILGTTSTLFPSST